MYELSIMTDFSAAHYLPGYSGKCRELHGHNWQVEVTIAGEVLDQQGMLLDFNILKKEVADVIATLDHKMLNELAPFQHIQPTSEHIAKYIYDALAAKPVFASAIAVKSIKVWESPRSAVLYQP